MKISHFIKIVTERCSIQTIQYYNNILNRLQTLKTGLASAFIVLIIFNIASCESPHTPSEEVPATLQGLYSNFFDDPIRQISCRNSNDSIFYFNHIDGSKFATSEVSKERIVFGVQSLNNTSKGLIDMGTVTVYSTMDLITKETVFSADVDIKNLLQQQNVIIDEPQDLNLIGLFENDLKVIYWK
jgi:hypothetical protein